MLIFAAMNMKRIAFQTFGCKLNFAETSAIARRFTETGYTETSFRHEADLYVIHSCSVTAHAEKKTRAAIRQALRRNPAASVAVIGCYAQLRPDELKQAGVKYVLGNNEKYKLPEVISGQHLAKNGASDKNLQVSRYFEPGFSVSDRTRSFFKVQDGCDYFCTYCAIPFARGRSRSASIKETMQAAQKVADTEVREMVLTGVNIGDFGHGSDENFYELLKNLEQLNGLDRIRISSVEPELLTDEIIELVAGSQKFMPHFHLPLQSGSDRILGLMKRKYKREIFEKRVNKIKSLLPHACIAADVITGFPDERNEDFEDGYRFIKSLPVSYLHVFTYSSRPGTKAAIMAGQLPETLKQQRSKELHLLSDELKNNFYGQHAGSEQEVL
ncbi:MAG: tRNA (N(6)-L-threonylcarbamoyladenosine(37)-C(2))-methylthiotransferase MtaB, partial [Lentimicrobiaceae bacterium]|nr:tRNA (N(6)-L-threonylcarbamoyladenosine(37)-C(2))-methylthiotransferase MtaB [Lentimicrobiaceae bacterium]